MRAISLDGAWRMHWCDIGGGRLEKGVLRGDRALHGPITARVPGDIHDDLVRAGIIDEPLEGLNTRACAWIERCEWWYSREFEWDVNAAQGCRRVELVFEGIDTTADIYLNGIYLGMHNTCYVPARFDVSSIIRSGYNSLVVRVDNGLHAVRHHSSRRYRTPVRYIHIRKPAYVFGWDWSPRLVTCGIWRSVHLEIFDEIALHSVVLRSVVHRNRAEIVAMIEIQKFDGKVSSAEVSMALTHRDRTIETSRTLSISGGMHLLKMRLMVDNPLLWWPQSLGNANLHPLRIQVSVNGRVQGEYRQNYGIRTVGLERRRLPRKEGRSFTITINGVRVFCKGANWAPADVLFPRVSDEKYRCLLTAARDANFTMLRVWGGGIYERPIFYELCDQYGILVWQDFHFTCALYPDDDPSFRETVRKEAEHAVRSLGNHACIVLWCGNNENHHFHTRGQWGKSPFYGRRIYHQILPAVVRRFHPEIPYWPGSPYGGRPANSRKTGDVHSYRVTLGENGLGRLAQRADYRYYQEERGKFISEFGVFGPPPIESIKRYLSPRERRLNSLAWKYHTNSNENGVLRAAISLFIGNPERMSLEQFLVAGQLVQAEALFFAIGWFRSRMFYCSGTLFWSFDDAWGEVGWSIIDYYTNPKVAYYAVRRAYAPIAVFFIERNEGGVLDVYVVNDTQQTFTATTEIGVCALSGKYRRVLVRRSVRVDACRVTRIAGKLKPFAVSMGSVRVNPSDPSTMRRICECTPRECVVYVRVERNGCCVAAHRWFAQPLRDTDIPEPKMSVRVCRVRADLHEVHIRAQTFILGAYVSLPKGCTAQDNYVDILPGDSAQLVIRGFIPSDQTLSVQSLNQLFL